MEDEGVKLQEANPSASGEDNRARVGFPQVKQEKKNRGKIIFIILAIIALTGVGAWLIFSRSSAEEIDEEPTPTIAAAEYTTPVPTEQEIDRSDVNIRVLNGSGISGAAGDLKEVLEGLGYSEVTTGNASDQDYTDTEVTFSSDINQAVKTEIVDELEGIYQDVNVKSGDAGEYDVEIITGYPKGYSPSPTAKPTTKVATPTPSIKVTVSPTQTPTPTP